MRTRRRDFLRSSAALLGASTLLPAGALARSVKKKAATLPFPELRAQGSPGTLGLAHGKAFAAQIKNNVGFYTRLLCRAAGVEHKALLAEAGRYQAPLRQHAPQLLEEIQGIARGSGRTVQEVLAVNARTDLLVSARRGRGPRRTPGCTAMALVGAAGGQPRVALGQTWDWNPALRGNIVVLRLKPAGGVPLVTFTEAGMVGKIGFNAHRLGVCLNFLSHPSDDPKAPPGVPVHCLLRLVMGLKSLEEAAREVFLWPRCASANLLVAQHRAETPRALSLELTPSAVGRVSPAGGVLVHTNHFLSPALTLGNGGRSSRSSANRLESAARLAQAAPGFAADPAGRMRRVLASRDGAPYCISLAGDTGSNTLAGVVMDLSQDRLHLVAGPPHKGRWVQRPGAA